MQTSLTGARVELSKRMYTAALYFEQLEHAGLIFGSGHHCAQAIAAFAVKLLEDRWWGPVDKEEDKI